VMSRQKEASDDLDRTLGGNEFQARAATPGNARSPRVDRRVDGTTSVDVLAESIVSLYWEFHGIRIGMGIAKLVSLEWE